jgi:CcmD family protein
MNSLVSAYLVFGLLIVGYLVKILLNQRSLRREIKALKERLPDGR